THSSDTREEAGSGLRRGPSLRMREFSGGHGEGETPVPIPNTEVKPLIADGTARETVWESRTLPEPISTSAQRGWPNSKTPENPRSRGFSFFAAVSPPPDSEPSAGGWTEQRERSLADASFAPAPDGQTFCRGRSAAKRPAWTQDGPHCVNVCRSLEASAFASAKRRGESGVQAGAARAVRYRSRAAKSSASRPSA